MPYFIHDPSNQISRYQRGIRLQRERREWSCAELGTRVGVTAHMISSLETGKTPGSVVLLLRIAHTFGMSLDDLISEGAE